MSQNPHYRILNHTDTSRLEEEVAKYLDARWQLHGNLTFANGRFYQAVTRDRRKPVAVEEEPDAQPDSKPLTKPARPVS